MICCRLPRAYLLERTTLTQSASPLIEWGVRFCISIMINHGIKLDIERHDRLGFDEAIYAEGKSPLQLGAIIDHATQTNTRRLFTRLPEAKFNVSL